VAEDRPDVLTASLHESPQLRLVCRAGASDVRGVLEGMDWVTHCAPVSEAGGRSAWRVELRDRDDTARMVRGLVQAGCEVEEVRPERLALEEVFLSLVREERAEVAT
jgi:hypothetical protein